MLTEDEAKEKWCPQMIQLDQDIVVCVASQCMAWRWGVEEGDPRKVGYCGLAGKP